MSLIKDPVLPKGALILVTGANGFIASHVIDHLLAAGYRVRGTVRDAQKNKWLQGFYDERYGQGKFELVEIKDYGAEGAFDAALEGVAGVNHTASDLSFSPDPNIVVTGTVVQCVGLLKAAAATPTVQRFVYTSSSTACTLPIPNQVFTIYPDTWNEVSVEAAWKPPPYEPDRVWDVYGASKTQAEKELWKFVKENKTGLVLNTVLPDTTIGKPVSVEHHGHPSTSGIVAKLAKANQAEFEYLVNLLAPQYFVDVEDVARLHVVAMLHPGVNNERVFAFAEPFNFNSWLAIFRKNFPDQKFLDDWPNLPKDLSKVAAWQRSVELLKEVGRPGFTSMEESILNNVEGVLP